MRPLASPGSSLDRNEAGVAGPGQPSGSAALVTRRPHGEGCRLISPACSSPSATLVETNRTLNEAIGLYRASGYREVDAFNDEPYADHWFEKTVSVSEH